MVWAGVIVMVMFQTFAAEYGDEVWLRFLYDLGLIGFVHQLQVDGLL